jgi:hypothetical protein
LLTAPVGILSKLLFRAIANNRTMSKSADSAIDN